MNVLQQRSRRVGTTAGWCVILLAALTLGASSASASICYQVSLPIGAAQAAGSICTDGTSGDLVQSNITAWHLLLSNGNAQGSLLDSWVWDSTASDTPLVTFWQTATPDPLTATAAALQWDFVDPGTGNYNILEFSNVSGGTTYYLEWTNYHNGFSYLGGNFGYNIPGGGGQLTYAFDSQLDGPQTYPSAPEPGSFALLFAGVTAFVTLARHRNTATQRPS